MNEQQIRDLVRRECSQLLNESGLSDQDIIIPNEDQITKETVAHHQISSLSFVKRIGDLVVLSAKRGKKVFGLIILLIGIYNNLVRPGAMLAFEKSLPDAVQLAHQAREGIIEIVYNIEVRPFDTPETFIVTSPSWENFTPQQYTTMAYDYLSGTRPIVDVFTPDIELIPVSGVPIEISQSSSSSSEDFA